MLLAAGCQQYGGVSYEILSEQDLTSGYAYQYASITLNTSTHQCKRSFSHEKGLGRQPLSLSHASFDDRHLWRGRHDGKVNPAKLNAFAYDPFQNGYYAMGEKVGQGWQSGAQLMKK